VTAQVSGPTCVTNPEEWYTWTTFPVGGDGNYSYRWEWSFNGADWKHIGANVNATSLKFPYNQNAFGRLRVIIGSAGTAMTTTDLYITIRTKTGQCLF
jgi:hypothetical protein